MKNKTICHFCDKVCETAFGNNTAPWFPDEPNAGCCNACDEKYVIPARRQKNGCDSDRLYEVALDIACESHADEECPNETWETNWPECATCKNAEKNAVHYDPKKDIACFKRYYLERAKERQAEILCGGGTDREGLRV